MEEEKKETLDQETIDRLLSEEDEEETKEEESESLLEEEMGEIIPSEELDVLRMQIQSELEQQQQLEQDAMEQAELERQETAQKEIENAQREEKSQAYKEELKAREDEAMRSSAERQAEMTAAELEESQRTALAETLGKAQKWGAEHPGEPGLIAGAGVDPYAYEKARAAEFVENLIEEPRKLGEKLSGEKTPEEREAEEKKRLEEEALAEYYGVGREKLEDVLKQAEEVAEKESWRQSIKEEAIEREKDRIRKYGTEEQKRELALNEARAEQEKARKKAEEQRLIGVSKYGTRKLEAEAKELAGDRKWYKPWKEEGLPAMTESGMEREWRKVEQEIRSNINKYPEQMYGEYLSLRDLREDISKDGITPTRFQALQNLKGITDKKLASIRTQKVASKTASATGRIAKGLAKGLSEGSKGTVKAVAGITQRGGPGYKRAWEDSPKIFGQSRVIPAGAQTRQPFSPAGPGEPKLKESPLSKESTRKEVSAMMGKDVFGRGISSEGWEAPVGLLGTQRDGQTALLGRITRGKMVAEAKPMPSDISEITGARSRPLETGYQRKSGYSPVLREMDVTKIVAPTRALAVVK